MFSMVGQELSVDFQLLSTQYPWPLQVLQLVNMQANMVIVQTQTYECILGAFSDKDLGGWIKAHEE